MVQEKTEASKVSIKEQRKNKLHSRRKRKDKGLSQRQSLSAAGTSWKSGVRRSTRIKTRPLEYWKGERLLYGRIHESLATVIGVKYMSLGSADGKPTMKVKSYVSDVHKELLEMASHY
ncbi:centromere protein C [Senna tora]|uniref:Centromere protein C n=1 Tax=Senna tora TaxID=362788 RepID=A0A835CHI0_9FABA|nr:centromere protein C [Senna tora]